MADFVASIDQGTTSTRCMIFDHSGLEVGRHQLEHEQILPKAGWVEHNPVEIWERTTSVVMSALNRTNLSATDLTAVGVTNQRETTVVWNRKTGRPYYNAIVWQDTRTDRIAAALDRDGRGDVIRRKAGLPVSPLGCGPGWRVGGLCGCGRLRVPLPGQLRCCWYQRTLAACVGESGPGVGAEGYREGAAVGRSSAQSGKHCPVRGMIGCNKSPLRRVDGRAGCLAELPGGGEHAATSAFRADGVVEQVGQVW